MVTGEWGLTRPLSEPLGDGSLTVLSSWGPCRISMNPPCAHEPKRNGELYRLNGKRGVRIASSASPLTPLWSTTDASSSITRTGRSSRYEGPGRVIFVPVDLLPLR